MKLLRRFSPTSRNATGLLAVSLALAGACGRPDPPAAQAGPAEVEYAGCYEVQKEGPVCYLGSKPDGRRLSLHPLAPADRYEIRIDGRSRAPLEPIPGAPGLLRVDVPPGAHSLELRAFTPGGVRAWTLAVADWPPLAGWLDEAWDLFNRGGEGVASARALLDREIARCSDPRTRALALSLRASLDPGDDAEARLAAFERAIAEYRRVGLVQGEAHIAAGVVFELVQKHDFARARAILQGVALADGRPLEAAYKAAYLRGLLAKYSGDFRTAIGEFENAARLAQSVGLDALQRSAEQEEATTLSQLGRFADSEALLGRLTAGAGDPCNRAILLTNRGWTRYLARDAGDWRVGDPIEPFLQARTIFRANQECRDRAREELNSAINLALSFLQADRLAEAEAIVAGASPLASGAGLRDHLWWLDLSARLALKQGRAAEALPLYERLAKEAEATLSPENQWRAAFGRARALQALGRLGEAARALARAEDLVDLQLGRVPVGEGRESFSDQWSAGSRLYVEILLKAGEVEKAFQAARRARARVLSQLAESARAEALSPERRRERDAALGSYWRLRNEIDRAAAESWQQPKSREGAFLADLQRRQRELQQALDQTLYGLSGSHAAPRAAFRRPRSGELMLAYFPLSSERSWVAFCDDGRRVEAREFSMPAGSLGRQGAALSRILLEPFAREIAAARRVVILPYGVLKGVDFQALPFGGEEKVLLSDRPVVYGLDIPTLPAGRPGGPARALVVANSRGDLPEAEEEGRQAERSLRRLAASWRVQLLDGPAASDEAVRRAISAGVDLLHYAGHADFSGRGGWESQIPLAGTARLTLGDILSLDRQPRWVVLSGCETGASDGTAQVESQGLAHAFLLGGAESVLAATRKVDDRVARELVQEIYRDMTASPDLAALLQRAQVALRARGVGERQWSSFRVFEP